MTEPLLIAKNNRQQLYLLPQMACRHGLITGAIVSTVGRQTIRGVPGSLLGGRK